MKVYNIYNWDAIKFCSHKNPFPMVLIRPDKQLVSKKGKVVVNISGTNSIYDGIIVEGLLTTSENMPNPRPNFFKQTGLWAVVLDLEFSRYPPKLGKLKIIKSLK